MTTLRMSEDFSRSNVSLSSEDWDRSTELEAASLSNVEGQAHDPSSPSVDAGEAARRTPRNSVVFPAGEHPDTPGREEVAVREGTPKRTLSELLRQYAEKGTELRCSQEEAASVGRVLGQWINSGSSPYEGDDDFFVRVVQDDSALGVRCTPVQELRPRGQSESILPPRSPQPVSASS